jgi:cyclin-dependent kinase 12/13
VREIKFLKSLQHKNIVLLKDVVTSKGCDHLELPIKTDSVKEDDTSASKQSDVGQIGEQKKLRNEYQDRENSFKDVMKICGNLYLVFEFVDHDIGGLIDAKYKFPVRAIKSIMKQLFEVLDFLNDKKIIHRDIKSSNILISSRHQVKLADFGLARSTLSSDGRESRVDMTNNVITMWYKPPELLLGAVRYGSAVDMWSAGCVLAELELGRPLFPGKAELEQLDLICRALGTPGEDVWPGVSGMANFSDLLKNLPKYAASLKISYGSKLSEPALNLLERILVVDPARRSSAKIALTNKYFLTSPLPPIDPADLEPLNVTSGVSYHEYKTKQVRKQREQEEAKKLSDAADAAALQLLPPPPQPPIPSSQLTTSSHNAPNPFTMTAPQHPAAPYLPRPPVQMVATNPYPQTGPYASTGGYGQQPAVMGYPRGAVLSSSGIQYGRGGPAHSVSVLLLSMVALWFTFWVFHHLSGAHAPHAAATISWQLLPRRWRRIQ